MEVNTRLQAQTVVAIIPDHVKDRRTDTLHEGESDMATFLLDVVKQAFDAEIVLLSALAFQGVLVYDKGVVTEADIEAEFSDSSPIIRSVPGSIVANMIKRSRRAKGTEQQRKLNVHCRYYHISYIISSLVC